MWYLMLLTLADPGEQFSIFFLMKNHETSQVCLCYLGEKYEQVTNVQFYKCTINHWFYSPNILITSVIYTFKKSAEGGNG